MNNGYINSKKLSKNIFFDLTKQSERLKYFKSKLPNEIEDIKTFIESNSFVAFLLAKKAAGKGTYSMMFQEVFGSNRFAHVSVGDTVREMHEILTTDGKDKDELMNYLKLNYRGFVGLDDAIESFLDYTQDRLISSEFILTIIKREIEKKGRKAIFIDGIPRDLDQISHALYFRDLINFRDDPDFFIVLEIPESVIEERIKYRRVCPKCKTSKNIKLNPSKYVQYDEEIREFYLICDNKDCPGYEKERLIQKKGDDRGVTLIRKRLDKDGELIEHAKNISGIPVLSIPGSVSVEIANEYYEEYELNPEFSYTKEKNGILTTRKPWVVKDDKGEEHYVLMAASVVLSIIKNIHSVLF